MGKIKKKDDLKARNFLISKYMYLAKYVSSKIPRYTALYTYEDIIQWACIGLIKAIERFNPERGIKFETYAISRIKGEIYDNIRKLLPYHSKIKKQIETLYEKIYKIKGRTPTYKEIAKEMGITVNKVKKLLKNYSPVFILSLEDLIKNHMFSIPQDKNEKNLFSEKKDILSKSIEKLSERERQIISLYYYEGLTLNEIAEILKISESRVSQIHTLAILHLQQIFKNYKKLWRENENIKKAVSKSS